MSVETILYIIFASITALFLALFQYYYKNKNRTTLSISLSILRFVTVFSVLLLLINPKFQQVKLTTEKPDLVVAVDNSNSIKYLKQNEKVLNLVASIANNAELNNKFEIAFYNFSEDFKNSDSLTFSGKQTNINQAFNQLTQIYKQSNAPTLLITDGNQTLGNDYEFAYNSYKQPIYPVILGDTITYTDLRIEQLNVNRYAFLKNKFPIETILVYNGNDNVNTKFTITRGNATLYSKNISFSKKNNSKIVNVTLPASRVGVRSYKATLIPINSEKNKVNNTKNFAVEVIDQKTRIAIVSDFPHPDLGAFKKSIERNEQRSVTVLNPNSVISQINDFQLFILYQPNNKFKIFFDLLNAENKNRFVVVGAETDLAFLNRINKSYTHEITRQLEDYQAALHVNYTPFLVDNIDFESFPPLKSHYGLANFKIPYQTILQKTVRGISINNPLLATFETDGRREAVLFGSGIWQWRAQSFMNTKSFNDFDDFMGKIVQYLASNKRRSRLNIDYESFYNGNGNIVLKAQIFDKNYQFDARKTLKIRVSDIVSEESYTRPLVLKNNNYQVDLSHLPPSEYRFTVSASEDNISKSGNFQILEYNVEQQFLNANVTKLQQLATNSAGQHYFIDDTARLITNLLNDNRYLSVQKSHKNSLPLIDWKYLLILIALSLAIEWFLRKYNGLI